MDATTSPLDYIAQASMDLTEAISSVSAESEKNTLINNHIRKLWTHGLPVDDFKKDLEWVNVSEPLSLVEHCSEKIVVLDFWTYCCINCYHVLPDLAHLKKLRSVEEGLVIIGVHCAKFTNEKDSSNILSAVQRYDIHHPVVNDASSGMWESLGIRCWPTLLVLGPGSKPLFMIVGEGHRDELVWYVCAALRYFGQRISIAKLPISVKSHIKLKDEAVLRFPSKVTLNPFYRGRQDEPFIAISDTGHHRIILTDCSGIILRIIGGMKPGFKDGKLGEAQFHSPQGVCWLSGSVLAVCDTGNHALRTVHLDEGTVEVLAGTGTIAQYGNNGGNCLALQALSSPWDVVLFTTPDMDMSVRAPAALLATPPASAAPHVLPAGPAGLRVPPAPPAPPPFPTAAADEDKDKKDEKRRVLLVACAGSHQIWAVFLDTTIWWKYKTYTEGTCICVAGSGAEAARNSTFPNTAAFAQPSGLTLKTGINPELFIADSESSSIRRLALSSGQVSTLAGGDRNPLNLFAFGDTDDIGTEAKFQHPLGVSYCDATRALYVADSYNNSIRRVDVNSQRVSTLHPTVIESTEPAVFKEPSGLAVTVDGKYVYVADTNNHSVKLINLAKNMCQEFRVHLPDLGFTEPENLILYKNDLFINRKGGHLIIFFNVSLDSAEIKNVNFTPGAPQNWSVCIRDEDNQDVTFDIFEFIQCSHKGSKLPGRVEMKLKDWTDKTHYRMYLSFHTALCGNNVCFSHAFTVRSTILVRDSVKMVESYKITCKVNPVNRATDGLQ